MNRNELARVGDRLTEFVEGFSSVFGRSERRHWCRIYLSGLVLDGERKSIEPLEGRVEGGNVQALQQFVNQSPWDGEELINELRRDMLRRFRMKSAIYILDDSSLPKKGNASVGVAHQYCGALGKLANCQCFVSLQGVGPRAHFPLAARLYLPEVWVSDPSRMKAAGVPLGRQEFKEKWIIALDLIDETTVDCRPEVLVVDAGYGANRVFLGELDKRQIPFVAQCRSDDTFWDGDMSIDKPDDTAKRKKGRPRKHERPVDKRLMPKTAAEWAHLLFAEQTNVSKIKINHKTPVVVEIVAKRVYEPIARPFHRVGPARWLVIERLSDRTFKYYVSSFPAHTTPKKMIRIAHQRYKVEQGYQQLKEELGLDHFEGRSWRGLHHHMALCFMAYDFLQNLARSQGRGKKISSASN
jgi:SRSO17 transposase